ncbi:SICA antigen [Plasmodium coatneyi]|uniref:SICA antigen n=1 Tax=Plasmodium coatneyi TaxID=208452 RepID=A0A1B1E2T8_9APIC|nr:SICA antigen [Plasmodium coatneyi]ANQ09169.1 SICA antigen [Plasmodium coatneyi]
MWDFTLRSVGFHILGYFFLGKRRKRHRRAHQVSGPPSLGELLAHVDDQADGPHEYTLVKERRQPRSAPTKTKQPKELVPGRSGVRRRMIIDIHLEVLDECQKGDTELIQEDYFKILVQEFMGSEFIKGEYVPEEDVPKEQVPSLDSRFREGRPCSKGRGRCSCGRCSYGTGSKFRFRVQAKIWDDMKTIFTNLMNTLWGEQPGIRDLCKDGMDAEENDIAQWGDAEKELCKAMMKVVLYTNGLTQDLAVRRKVDGEDIVDTYFRCLVGNAVLVELYGSNCRFDKVLPYVSGIVGATVQQLHGKEMTDEKCSAFNRQDAQIGGKLISKTISDWINDGKWKDQAKIRNYNAIETQGKNCTQDATSGKGRKGTGEEDNNKERKDIEEKVSEIKEIIDKGETVSQTGANQVMEKMNPNDSEDDMKRKLKKGIENKVQEEKEAADSMESDIKSVATCMFASISTNSTKMQSYCTAGHTETDSRRVTDPEKKACHYITAGLKHIYEIKADEGKNAPEEKKKAEDDRLFKQTMLCLVLNAFADELREKVKSPCEVSDETIKQAFDKGNGERVKWCKHKVNGKSECVQCDRYGDYANCTIGGTKETDKVGQKLHELFKSNSKKEQLDQGLSSTFKSLCDRTQCVITQWTRDKRIERNKTKGEPKREDIWEVLKGFILNIAV